MSSKIVYGVGADGRANYSSLANIPSEILVQRDTSIQLYPGTYTAPTNAVYDDIAFIGTGDREEIVINGDMTLANTSANTITFENITFVGSNAVTDSGTACVTKLGTGKTKLHFKNCNFSNAEHAVSHNGIATLHTTTPAIVMDFCDASAVDQAIVANSNVEINFSALNTGSNAYFTPGTGGGDPALTVTVRASTSGGSNTGNNTETVLALIS